MANWKRKRRFGSQKTELLSDLLKNQGVASLKRRDVAIFSAFHRVVPERVRANVRPQRLDGKTLWLEASSGIWAQEVQMMSHDLLTRLRREVPKLKIERLKVVANRRGWVSMRKFADKTPIGVRPIPPTSLPESVARSLASVQDDKMREVLQDAACATLARRKRR